LGWHHQTASGLENRADRIEGKLRIDHRLASTVASVLDEVPVDFGGGCSLLKANLFAQLIRAEDMKCTLDIGVYRGRSLLPQALAHKAATNGIAYGVDPWDSTEARQNDAPAAKQTAVDEWVQGTDLQGVYDDLVRRIEKVALTDNCTLVRATSSAAAKMFHDWGIWFDLIHIDGNHDRERVESDIENYLPRLRRRGYLVLDDIAWDSIGPSYSRMRENLTLVFELVDAQNEFAVYWNGRNAIEAEVIRLNLLRFGPMTGMLRRWRRIHF
jgi:predicted O-methyltransferase YrrM